MRKIFIISLLLSAAFSQYAFANDQADQKSSNDFSCPDPTTQFIVFAPSDDGHPPIMQQEAETIAQLAEKSGLKTIRLTLKDTKTALPTRENYLRYLSCPNLIGTFATTHGYADGKIETSEPNIYITAADVSQYLKGKFKYKVMVFWDACLVFSTPMATALIEDAQAQKFIAGITRLPINKGAEISMCAMEKILTNRGTKNITITDALNQCWGYDPYGKDPYTNNKWGINIDHCGSDYFGQPPL